jgi:RNA polymerase sigma factor (sigma-70 family)
VSRPDPRVAQAIALADEVAEQIYLRFGREVPFDEIRAVARSNGVVAAERWDGRGLFPKYAVQRIRWAVLDSLRRERRRTAAPGAAAMQHAAALNAERAGDLAALADATAVEPPDPAAALRAFLGGAAASFTVELDAAGLLAVADPREDVETTVDRMRVRRAAAALPEPERSVLERHSYDGATFAEIAAADGVPQATVFSCYSRAVEKLRRAFEGGA